MISAQISHCGNIVMTDQTDMLHAIIFIAISLLLEMQAETGGQSNTMCPGPNTTRRAVLAVDRIPRKAMTKATAMDTLSNHGLLLHRRLDSRLQ